MTREKAIIDVTVNNESAQQKIKELQEDIKRFHELRKKAEADGNVEAFKTWDKAWTSATRQASALGKESLAVEQVLKRINGASFDEIAAASRKATSELRKMKQTDPGYAEAQKNAQLLKTKMVELSKQAGVNIPLWEKMKSSVSGLLPAFGFAAIASGAKYAFSQVVASTDVLSTQWAIFTGGLKSGMNEFWRTIATGGDWGNFLTNFREAVKVGRQYEQMIDQIEEKTRSLRVQEAESRAEELRLEDMLRNKTLSKAERIKAGQDRIALEENLARQRVKVAQDTFDAELAVTMQQTGLSKDRLMDVVSDLDSETKAKAQAYNEQLKIYESAQKKNEQTQAGLSRAGVTGNPFAEQMEKSKAILDSYPDSVKNYATALRGVGSTTDEQLNKMVSAYEGLLAAQNSAAENTKRVRTQVNSLLAGEDEKKAVETIIKQLDKANNERTAILIEQFEKEKWTDERFKEESLAAEIAYLALKKEILAKYGESTIQIETQINDKRLEYIKLNNSQALKELEKMKAQIKELEQKDIANFETNNITESSQLADSITATAKSIEESMRIIETAKDKEKQVLEERQQAYLNFSLMVGSSLGNLMNNSEATFADYLKNILVMSLDALHQFFLLKKAEVLIDAAAGAATGRFWKIAGAVAAVVAMEAAYQGIRGGLTAPKNDKTAKKSDETAKHADGGYAYEEQYIVSENNKPEWIAPNWMLTNPGIAPVIKQLDKIRETKRFVGINTPGGNRPLMFNLEGISNAIEYSRGHNTMRQIISSNTPTQPSINHIQQVQQVADPELKKLLAETSVVLNKLLKWNPKVTTQLIKNDLETLDYIEKNSGL